MSSVLHWIEGIAIAAFLLYALGSMDTSPGDDESDRRRAEEEQRLLDEEIRRRNDDADAAYWSQHNPHDHHR
ncbi:hypothetical protein [Burkholderia pseudomallei]|uniref:hypothetical protein n=1 Tax=Burkholderia pseudomallei TaxID=28450 RepID=UPI0011782FC3|nr:hypothetical protein [Burkholderia pseudomallei]